MKWVLCVFGWSFRHVVVVSRFLISPLQLLLKAFGIRIHVLSLSRTKFPGSKTGFYHKLHLKNIVEFSGFFNDLLTFAWWPGLSREFHRLSFFPVGHAWIQITFNQFWLYQIIGLLLDWLPFILFFNNYIFHQRCNCFLCNDSRFELLRCILIYSKIQNRHCSIFLSLRSLGRLSLW